MLAAMAMGRSSPVGDALRMAFRQDASPHFIGTFRCNFIYFVMLGGPWYSAFGPQLRGGPRWLRPPTVHARYVGSPGRVKIAGASVVVLLDGRSWTTAVTEDSLTIANDSHCSTELCFSLFWTFLPSANRNSQGERVDHVVKSPQGHLVWEAPGAISESRRP